LPREYVKAQFKKRRRDTVKETDNGVFISSRTNKELQVNQYRFSGQLYALGGFWRTYKCAYDEVNITFSEFDELK